MVLILIPSYLPPVLANPSGGTVVGGAATISTGPGQVTVRQGSDRAVVNWGSFSIRQGETTTFVQPSSRSAVLNRVTGGGASQLDGNLNANGQVYLVNRNGVVVGKTGRVNTGGFTASTHDVADAQFMKGGDLTFSGNSNAKVVNYGKIRAADGDVTLIARQVENYGKISAKKGQVTLAGGSEVLVKPSGTDGKRVFIRSGAGSVENSGTIRATTAELRAAGGNEYALAVNNTGVIRATAVDRSGGRIVLKAERGTAQNSGRLIARSDTPGKSGGAVVVTGDQVKLTSASRIDVSSATGKGGTVNIGGGYQGKDTAIANAKTTTVEAGSEINADGGTQGGTSIIWSDDTTQFAGSITARGPGGAGTGGFVEVSGKGRLDFYGMVDTNGGTLLLDPNSITISTAANSFVSETGTTPNLQVTHMGSADSILNVTYLVNTLLASNNVTLLADNFITVDAAITSGSGFDLILNAPTLNLNAPINLTNVASSLSGSATLVNVGALGKIQNGVDAVASGGEVKVAAGTFLENVRIIGKSLTLTGSGAAGTIVNGNAADTVITIVAAGQTVTLNSLTITNGNNINGGGISISSGTVRINNSTISGNSAFSTDFFDPSRGGGIYNLSGNVEINNSTISGNTSVSEPFSFSSFSFGGGIYNNSGTVEINNSTISGNSVSASSATGSSYAHGGGIFNNSGTVAITGSTISGNSTSTTYYSYAGAIYNDSGTVAITGSTINGNTSTATAFIPFTSHDYFSYGGGIYNASGTVEITNSTISGNTSTADSSAGGGIYNDSGTVKITNSTISENYTNASAFSFSGGGGIYNASGTVEITNSIIALNRAYAGDGPNVYGNVSDLGSNLVGSTADSTGFNSSISELDATDGEVGLAPLGWYGGPTRTYALLVGSHALNNGATTLGTDQRGQTRGVTGSQDIGAYEASGILPVFDYTVRTTADYNPNAYSPADALPIANSLRVALTFAEAPTTVTFDIPDSAKGLDERWTITAAAAAPGTTGFDIRRAITINGSSQPVYSSTAVGPRIVVNGNAAGGVTASVFNINPGTGAAVILDSLGITGGNKTGNGGGLNITSGNVTISNSRIYGNRASDHGGGIYKSSGSAVISNSIISGNYVTNIASSGGGIYNIGSMEINHSTISGNYGTASSFGFGSGGGGIFHGGGAGTLQINYSTISRNYLLASDSAGTAFGGGIYVNVGAVEITNSTISENYSSSPNRADGGGLYNAGGNVGITNSTISGNYVTTATSSSIGGGIYHSGGVMRIANSTISRNYAFSSGSISFGGGIRVLGGTVEISNSIIALNTATTGPNVRGDITDLGYNLVGSIADSDGFGTGAGTQIITDANVGLAPLGWYGGPTQTHALLPGSPALNAGSSVLTIDQRGESRNDGDPDIGAPDIGAYESRGFTYTPGTLNAVLGETYSQTITVTPKDLDLATVYLTFTPLTNRGTVTLELPAVAPGTPPGIAGLPTATTAGPLTQTIDASGQITFGSLTAAVAKGTFAVGVAGSPTGFDFENLPIALTVTADAAGKIYGDLDPALSYSFTSGTLLGPDFDIATLFTLSREAGENVGIYDILGILNAYGDSRYTVTVIGADNFTIAPRAITIAAVPGQGKTYGDADPSPLAITITVGNLVAGDSLTGALSRAMGENAGLYAISQGTLSAGNNYAVTYIGGDNFTITPRALLILPTAGQGKTAGFSDPALTFTYTSTLAPWDTASTVFPGGFLTRVQGEDVGLYLIGLTPLATSFNPNYTLSLGPDPAYFRIQSAPLPPEPPVTTVTSKPAFSAQALSQFNATRGRNNEDPNNPDNLVLKPDINLKKYQGGSITYDPASHPYPPNLIHLSSYQLFGQNGTIVQQQPR